MSRKNNKNERLDLDHEKIFKADNPLYFQAAPSKRQRDQRARAAAREEQDIQAGPDGPIVVKMPEVDSDQVALVKTLLSAIMSLSNGLVNPDADCYELVKRLADHDKKQDNLELAAAITVDAW
jgi:hypothetical protein